MTTETERVEVLGIEWDITFDYYEGTNHYIHSASSEPNDNPELYVSDIQCADDSISEELVKFILENVDVNDCPFEAAAWRCVR